MTRLKNDLFLCFNAAAPPQDCLDGEISCDGQCFPEYIRCNGYADCSNGIDEENCATTTEQTDYRQIITTQAPTVFHSFIAFILEQILSSKY